MPVFLIYTRKLGENLSSQKLEPSSICSTEIVAGDGSHRILQKLQTNAPMLMMMLLARKIVKSPKVSIGQSPVILAGNIIKLEQNK